MTKTEFKLTGWHVFALFAAAFSVIIAVNVTLAVNAVRTFPGVETDNSYISSQTFQDRRAAQEALGWQVAARHDGEVLMLEIRDEAGQPVQAARLDATLGRPTHVKDDRTPRFRFDGQAYVAQEQLDPGNWNIRMKATALDGTPFEQRVVFYING